MRNLRLGEVRKGLASLVVLLLLAVGCASTAEPTAAPTPTTTGSAPPTSAVSPTTVPALGSTIPDAPATTTVPAASPEGHDELRVELQAVFSEWFEASTAPGASMAVQLSDGAVLKFVAGQSDLQDGSTVEEDSVFRIASISKSLTAATVLSLVEEGLIDLDARVAGYLGPDWAGIHPNASEITVRQLLGHTSGLVEYAFNPAFGAEAQGRYGTPWEPEEILDFVGRQGPEFAPGAAFSYNTGGFIAAGLLIEEVTGETAAEVLLARLFDPAGATAIGLAPQDELSEHHVSGYVDGGLARLMIGADPQVDQGIALAGGTPVVDVLTVDQASMRSSAWTGGGVEADLASTAAVWHAMFDGTILGPEAVAELVTPLAASSYGLGVRLATVDGSPVYSHTGGTAGFMSEAGYIEAADASFAMSANTSAAGHGVNSLASRVIQVLLATGYLTTLSNQPDG